MRFKPYRITVFAATSLACAVISFGVPVTAQEAEAEATPIEATINDEAIPENAKTLEEPTIEVDDLELLIKPLTLEELENEAAAWLILLKKKVQELSASEIVVKHQNRKLEAQNESLKLFDEAKVELSAVEPDQSEQAVQQLETAKESLKQAEASAKKLKAIEGAEQENKVLQDSLKQGRKARGINEGKTILARAKQIRPTIAPNSPQYREITKNITALEDSINNLEQAEAELESQVPNSAAYKEAESKANQAREAFRKDRDQLLQSMSGLTGVENSDIEIPTESLAAKSAKIEAEFAQASTNFEQAMAEFAGESLDNSKVQELDQQIEQVMAALNKKVDKENELKRQLVVNVTDLEAQRAGIINRFIVVLDALDNKGGDSASYRKYIENVSTVDLDFTDTEGLGVRFVTWLTSPDGGLNLIINIAKFGGILLISVILAPQVGKLSNNILTRVGGMSILFRDFTVMVIKRGVVVLGFLLGLAAMGVNLGPILALIGGASFILAFALQSNLANFASGLMLLINKPFDVGDEVKVAGYWAYVDSISLASTKIKDFGGSIITLPNNTVWGSDIINYTHADVRKLGLAIHVKFEQDLDKVYKMWMEITAAHPKVLDDPAPSWFPWNGHYDYYIWVNLTAWSKTDDYWYVYVDLLKELQRRIQDLDIQLTAPQQEIKLDKLLPEQIANQI